jgi:hypothetical protein
MMLSIGGNDAHFSSIIEHCLLHGDCPVSKVDPKVFAGGGLLHNAVQRALQELPDKYQTIEDCLRGGLGDFERSFGPGSCSVHGVHLSDSVRLGADTPLLVTDYADVTKGQDGSYCSALTGIGIYEFEWTDQVVLNGRAGTHYERREGRDLPVKADGLNTQIRSLSSLSWTPVETYGAFREHGYCAGDDSWVRSLTQSRDMQDDNNGAFHPDQRGHGEIGQMLRAELRTVLGI